jgi:hypothetical protein
MLKILAHSLFWLAIYGGIHFCTNPMLTSCLSVRLYVVYNNFLNRIFYDHESVYSHQSGGITSEQWLTDLFLSTYYASFKNKCFINVTSKSN